MQTARGNDYPVNTVPGCWIGGLQVLVLGTGVFLALSGADGIRALLILAGDGMAVTGTVAEKPPPERSVKIAPPLRHEIGVAYTVEGRDLYITRNISRESYQSTSVGDTVDLVASRENPGTARLAAAESTGWGWYTLQVVLGLALAAAGICFRRILAATGAKQ